MIGIYDSGIGGITIYKELCKFIDTRKMVYYADNQNSPLGDKSEKEVQESVAAACEYLFENGCSLILLACNTATVAAVRYIQNDWLPKNYFGRKVLGIVRPVSEGLLEEGASIEDNILVMSTELTHLSKFYHEELGDAGFKNIHSIPMMGLATAVESQNITEISRILNQELTKIPDIHKLKYIVLACTHYPLVKKEILETMINLGASPDLYVFDQGKHVANKLMDYLARHKDVVLSDLGGIFFVNGNSDDFEKQLKEIFKIDGYVMEV